MTPPLRPDSTNGRLRLKDVRERIQALRNPGYGGRHVLAGDGSGNVEITGTDLVIARVSATGRPIVVLNPARRGLTASEALEVYPIGQTTPAGWYVPPDRPRFSLYFIARISSGSSGIVYFRLPLPTTTPPPPSALVNLGAPTDPIWSAFTQPERTANIISHAGYIHVYWQQANSAASGATYQSVHCTRGGGVWFQYPLPLIDLDAEVVGGSIGLYRIRGILYATYQMSATLYHTYRLDPPNTVTLVDTFTDPGRLLNAYDAPPTDLDAAVLLVDTDSGAVTETIAVYRYAIGSAPVVQDGGAALNLDGVAGSENSNSLFRMPTGHYLYGKGWEADELDYLYRSPNGVSGWSQVLGSGLRDDEYDIFFQVYNRAMREQPEVGVYHTGSTSNTHMRVNGLIHKGLVHYGPEPTPGPPTSLGARRLMVSGVTTFTSLVSVVDDFPLESAMHSVVRLPPPDNNRILVSMYALTGASTSPFDGGIYSFDEARLVNDGAFDWHNWLPSASMGGTLGVKGGPTLMAVVEDVV